MTDAELVARLKANDDEAYREVLARYGDSLYGYLYSLSGDHHLCEDILSETYLRMIEKIDTYTFYGAPFKAWLYRIAHNRMLNALQRAPHLVALDKAEALLPPLEDAAASIMIQVEYSELRAGLLELTTDQQQVLLLRFLAEYSSGTVAEIMGKSENAVKQLQFRALRSLGRHLEQRAAAA